MKYNEILKTCNHMVLTFLWYQEDCDFRSIRDNCLGTGLWVMHPAAGILKVVVIGKNSGRENESRKRMPLQGFRYRSPSAPIPAPRTTWDILLWWYSEITGWDVLNTLRQKLTTSHKILYMLRWSVGEFTMNSKQASVVHLHVYTAAILSETTRTFLFIPLLFTVWMVPSWPLW